MKKSIKVLIFILIVIIVLAVTVWYLLPINNAELIKAKGNIIFGTINTCKINEPMTTDITKRKCIFCNKEFKASSSAKICHNCCIITNRCSVCGKLKQK
ncbi:MAG: hypothetical protein U0L98_01015 [Clostridia bacterium]|jgi:hypothetical protein|nr:hypothetical protein [Clostridia bacterium]